MAINIKASHKGLFTAKAKATGASVAAYADKMSASKTASSATKKQAVFAKNAQGFKH